MAPHTCWRYGDGEEDELVICMGDGGKGVMTEYRYWVDVSEVKGLISGGRLMNQAQCHARKRLSVQRH